MRDEPGAEVDTGSGRERPAGIWTGKYRVALALYAILAALGWFTLDGRIPVGGRLVELRLIPLVVIGGFALRTVVAMKAEKIRREGERALAAVQFAAAE